ncbi:protocadherin Fat 4-like [Pecten maximus]|uniref:protocadherin Fat 4-like n=1 Tax=Pecten maximus TaxID=6579 RepID=UPI0014588831|nr:protocadherin Fat 4-like [Pecten maximus]
MFTNDAFVGKVIKPPFTGNVNILCYSAVSRGYTATVPLTVHIVDVNDNTPRFSPEVYMNVIPENSPAGTSVRTLTCRDDDSGANGLCTLRIQTGDDVTHKFAISGKTLVTTGTAIDYEALPSRDRTYSLVVVGVDSPSPSGYSVNEDIPVGTTIATVLATDADDGEDGTLKYSIIARASTVISNFGCRDSDSGTSFTYTMTQNPGNKFIISNAGALAGLVLNDSLDYETAPYYNLEVTVTDNGYPARSSTISIDVTVLNVNEDQPVFTNTGTYMVFASEDTSIGSTLVTVTATDKDAGDAITYAFVTPYLSFHIDHTLGTILLVHSLDYETADSHVLLVTASDGMLSTTATVTLEVGDVNEVPSFTQTTYTININENQPPGTHVGRVFATDLDAGASGRITYTISDGDGASFFTVDSFSGMISPSAVIDYEVNTFFFLIVQASDAALPSLTAQCLVNVRIRDDNDNAPVFIPHTYAVLVSEEAAVGTTVTTISATDIDSVADNNNVFEFSTISTVPFTIHSTSGVIRTNALLDRELLPIYNMVILATDKGAIPLTGTSTITISLIDVNDNDPSISGTYDSTVDEDTAVNTVVFTIIATDLDYGRNSQLSYSIVSGNTDACFKIESRTGIIQTVNTLDRELQSFYKMEVHVTDDGIPPRNASVTCTVTIRDVNDNAPHWITQFFVLSIEENVAIGSSVGFVKATDADIGMNSALTYEIVNYWVGGSNQFVIDSSSGLISSTEALNREIIDTYVLWCRVYDGGSPMLLADSNVTITVSDLNDNNPVFEMRHYSGNIRESSQVGTAVLRVSANDADTGVNALLSYSLYKSARAAKYFNINATTGIIHVKALIDREKDPFFSFKVFVTDSGAPPRTGTTKVSITVQDVNDNRPEFKQEFYNTEVPHSDTCSSVLTTITATDVDEGPNALVSYYFDKYSEDFNLDAVTGKISASRKLTSGKKYIEFVFARDNGNPELKTRSKATVRIDAYKPSDVVLLFHLGVNKSYFESVERAFLSLLTGVYRVSYPTAVARRWCLIETSER